MSTGMEKHVNTIVQVATKIVIIITWMSLRLFQPGDTSPCVLRAFLQDTPWGNAWRICVRKISPLVCPRLNIFICGKFMKINHKLSLEEEKNERVPQCAVDPLKYEQLGGWLAGRDPHLPLDLGSQCCLPDATVGFLQHHDGVGLPGICPRDCPVTLQTSASASLAQGTVLSSTPCPHNKSPN